jgi:anti-anti-sigma regulatory factor
VKRISSTRSGKRPKKKAEGSAPEAAESMEPLVKAMAGAVAGTPVTGLVRLPAVCTIHEARALQAHLLEQLDRPGPCEIDGSAVQQVDTAGVQLVVAFALDCLERNLSYVWKGRSAVLEDAIRVLGVGALLESPG